jgi:DNA repair exonuclease SbcCD nuclease subunit
MKFAHLADCHIGSWRDPKLKEISVSAFVKAIDAIKDMQVDFVLISGDLFNTSMPSMDILKTTVVKLKELKDSGINVYIIAGSHDFSPSGKTILDVLEQAGLFTNVVKGNVVDGKLQLRFTTDEKTNVKITGMLGRKGMLDRSYYEALDKENLEAEEGFKIFMFHTALSELKPQGMEHMDASPLSLLPSGFDYYAGGHVHVVMEKHVSSYGTIVFPGPIFPNNFAEIEQLKRGGFYLYDDSNEPKMEYHPIQICNVFSVKIDAEGKNPEMVKEEILMRIEKQEFIDTIVTIRVKGTLRSGKPSDVDFAAVFKAIYDKGALFVMKNTVKLETKEFEEIKTEAKSVEEIEENVIREHAGQIKLIDNTADEGEDSEEGEEEGKRKEKEKSAEEQIMLTKKLMQALYSERDEGERVGDFEEKVKESARRILGLNKE